MTKRPDWALADNGPTHAGSAIATSDADAARVTAAEYALAGGWTTELGDVLDALGLRGEA